MRETRLRPLFNRSSELPHERWGCWRHWVTNVKLYSVFPLAPEKWQERLLSLLQENPSQDVTVSPNAPDCSWLPAPSPPDILCLIFGQSGGRQLWSFRFGCVVTRAGDGLVLNVVILSSWGGCSLLSAATSCSASHLCLANTAPPCCCSTGRST